MFEFSAAPVCALFTTKIAAMKRMKLEEL